MTTRDISIDQIHHDWASGGYSRRSLASKHHIGEKRLASILTDSIRGARTHPLSITPPSREALLEAYTSLVSMSAVARKYGVTYPTVRKWLKKYDISQKSGAELAKAVWAVPTNQKYPSQTHIPKESLEILNDSAKLIKFMTEGGYSRRKACEILGVSETLVDKRLHKHGLGDLFRFVGAGSSVEILVCEFLDAHDIQYIRNDRKILASGLELDIVIPAAHTAIEVCGLYWHAEWSAHKRVHTFSKRKHSNKTEEAQAAGYRLLTLWDSEILAQQTWEIIQSMILIACKHKSIISVGARTTNVDFSVNKKRVSAFMKENHIQGAVGFSHSVCLTDKKNGEILGAATFGASRYNSSAKWELLRLCTRQRYSIVGGASRMISAFRKHDNRQGDSIISYCDLRHSTGGVYSKLGFTPVNITPPSYRYTRDYIILENRMKYQRHRLGGDELKGTEWEIMRSRGYDRVWDCGQAVWMI